MQEGTIIPEPKTIIPVGYFPSEGTMVLRERFARNIKYQREKHRWTQETAAEICDLSPRYWGKLERGAAAASIDTMEKVSKGLRIGIEELLKEENKSEEAR